jgi:16S rRNA processing protein RimM
MDKFNFCLFGTFVKVNGVKGELIIHSYFRLPDKIKSIPFIFIEIDGILVPFCVLNFFIRSDFSAVSKLEGIDTKDDALEFVDKKVFISKDYLNISPEPEFSLLQYIDFVIFDSQEKELGKIVEIIEIPENPIAKIIINKKEVLIPINNKVIISVNMNKKIIFLNISQGLLDIYL